MKLSIRIRKRRLFSLGFYVLLGLVIFSTCSSSIFPQQEKISKFGEYKGYSTELYDSWVRVSQYLTMRDGVRLAVDIIRPAKQGKPNEEPLPVIWIHNRYRRAFIQEGRLISAADFPLYKSFLKYGYVLVNVDVRGSGASFGSWQGIFTPAETQDSFEITEWLASQPWSDGNIGMFGGSYLGITQLMCASTKPPNLKAIFPMVSLFDIYTVGYHNGVFYDDLLRTWSELTKILDTEVVAVGVDSDPEGKLLKAAIEEHKSNRSSYEIFAPLKFRDSLDEISGEQPYYKWHPAAFVREINESGVPIYLWCGWFDSFTKDGFLLYRNFSNPKKIVIGAWSHSPRDPEIAKEEFSLAVTEALRWFDYWLKEIENGIMDEPPIRYQLMKAKKENEWRTAREWPLPQEKRIKYFFHQGKSGSVDSVNDGLLSPRYPNKKKGNDDYAVDYTATTGQATRWDNAVGGSFEYPDLRANDEKGLTYTTEPLSQDVEVTGHPVAHLWLSTTTSDLDVFLYLEEIDPDGFSHYVTEGAIRASHRALHQPYYDNLNLPFHRSHEEDYKPLISLEPVELVFDLQPTSNVFNAGNRIRVTITCADKDNAEVHEESPPPIVSIYRNKKLSSYIILPLISEEEARFVGEEEFPLAMVSIILFIVIIIIALTLYIRRRIR